MSSFTNKIFIVTKREVFEMKTIYKTNETINFAEALKFLDIIDKQENNCIDKISYVLNTGRQPTATSERKKISTTFYPIEV